jgi:hypothetical protein
MSGGDYGRIRHTFWTDPDIKRKLSPDEKLLLVYLFSSPHSNMIGLYHLPLEYAALETGLSVDSIRSSISASLSPFVSYDDATEEVFVHRAARHQIADELQATDKRAAAVRKALAETHSEILRGLFARMYPTWPHGIEAPSPSEKVDKEAPSKPLRSQCSSSNRARARAPARKNRR